MNSTRGRLHTRCDVMLQCDRVQVHEDRIGHKSCLYSLSSLSSIRDLCLCLCLCLRMLQGNPDLWARRASEEGAIGTYGSTVQAHGRFALQASIQMGIIANWGYHPASIPVLPRHTSTMISLGHNVSFLPHDISVSSNCIYWSKAPPSSCALLSC